MARCKDWGQPHEHAHGTTTGWGYHGCRCSDCEVAHYTYQRDADRKRASNPDRLLRNRRHLRSRRAVDPQYGRSAQEAYRGPDRSRQYRQQNRSVINERCRTKCARIRAAVRAERRWWTPEDDATVLREDINLTEMAYMLHRTPRAIAQRRSRLRQGAQPRYYRSDIECMRGHSRTEHGYRNDKQWVCRECQRAAKARHLERKEQAA